MYLSNTIHLYVFCKNIYFGYSKCQSHPSSITGLRGGGGGGRGGWGCVPQGKKREIIIIINGMKINILNHSSNISISHTIINFGKKSTEEKKCFGDGDLPK